MLLSNADVMSPKMYESTMAPSNVFVPADEAIGDLLAPVGKVLADFGCGVVRTVQVITGTLADIASDPGKMFFSLRMGKHALACIHMLGELAESCALALSNVGQQFAYVIDFIDVTGMIGHINYYVQGKFIDDIANSAIFSFLGETFATVGDSISATLWLASMGALEVGSLAATFGITEAVCPIIDFLINVPILSIAVGFSILGDAFQLLQSIQAIATNQCATEEDVTKSILNIGYRIAEISFKSLVLLTNTVCPIVGHALGGVAALLGLVKCFAGPVNYKTCEHQEEDGGESEEVRASSVVSLHNVASQENNAGEVEGEQELSSVV